MTEQSTIDEFKQKATSFFNLFNKLKSQQAIALNNPAVKNEYQTLFDDGLGIKSKIDSIMSALNKTADVFNSAKDWLMDTIGLSGIEAETAIKTKKVNLGLLPLVAIGGAAVIGGVITAITNWVYKASIMTKKLDEIKRLQSQGMSAEKAYTLVNEKLKNDSGFLNINLPNFNFPLIALISGGLGLFYWVNRNKRKK